MASDTLLLRTLVLVLLVALSWQRGNRIPKHSRKDFSKEYLQKYGYLSRVEGRLTHNDEESTTKAIRDFQKFANLRVTGFLNRETLKKMKLPRCGIKDVEPSGANISRMSNYETRAKWHKKHLTWKVSKYTDDMDYKSQIQIIERAFRYWSDVSPLTFTQIHTDTPDIVVQFVGYGHGDGADFDGEGGVIAHAFFPGQTTLSRNTLFDNSEVWRISGNTGTNLLMVATHEFGHAIGLGHSSSPGSVMGPFYNGFDENFRLQLDDIEGVQKLYGVRTTDTTLAVTPTATPVTQLFVWNVAVLTFPTIVTSKISTTTITRTEMPNYPATISPDHPDVDLDLPESIWRPGRPRRRKKKLSRRRCKNKRNPNMPRRRLKRPCTRTRRVRLGRGRRRKGRHSNPSNENRQPRALANDVPTQPSAVADDAPTQPRAVSDDPSTQPRAAVDDVPTQPRAVTDDASKQPKAVTHDVPEQPRAVTDDAPKPPRAVTDDALKQPKTVTDDAPKQPKVVTDDAPKQPKAVTDDAPNQMRTVTDDARKQPTAVTDDAPKQPKTLTDDAPKQPGAVTDDALTQPKAVTDDAPKHPRGVTDDVPTQPRAMADDVSTQPRAVADDVPTQLRDVADNAPKQPKTVTDDVPTQPRAVTDDAPIQLTTVTDDAPTQPRAVTDDAPTQPRAVVDDVTTQPIAVTDDAPKQPRTVTDDAPKQLKTMTDDVSTQLRTVTDDTPKQPRAVTDDAPKQKPTKDPMTKLCRLKFDAVIHGLHNKTYAFRKRYMYEISTENITKTKIKRILPKCPINIAAAVFHPVTKHLFIFKGTKVWKYIDDKLVKSYPRNITDYRYQEPSAAVLWHNGLFFLFKDSKFWAWDEHTSTVANGYPTDIGIFWPRLPENVDAALRHKDTNIYFFKGRKFYMIDSVSRAVIVSYPKPIAETWLNCRAEDKIPDNP